MDLGSLGPSTVTFIAFVYVATWNGTVLICIVRENDFPVIMRKHKFFISKDSSSATRGWKRDSLRPRRAYVPLPLLPTNLRSLNLATWFFMTAVQFLNSPQQFSSFPALMVTRVPSLTSSNATTLNATGRDLFDLQCVGSALQRIAGLPVCTRSPWQALSVSWIAPKLSIPKGPSGKCIFGVSKVIPFNYFFLYTPIIALHCYHLFVCPFTVYRIYSLEKRIRKLYKNEWKKIFRTLIDFTKTFEICLRRVLDAGSADSSFSRLGVSYLEGIFLPSNFSRAPPRRARRPMRTAVVLWRPRLAAFAPNQA